MKGSQLDVYDKEVIEIAELLVEKWRAYQIDSDNEDPDATAEALEIAVDQRNKNLGVETTIREKAEAIYPKPTPSITVGTQVRLTGVVTGRPYENDGPLLVRILGGSSSEILITDPSSLEVIRQPFKRGEVVWLKADTSDNSPHVVVNDENQGMVEVASCHDHYLISDSAKSYERRPSRPEDE